jgi:hypothetical protein
MHEHDAALMATLWVPVVLVALAIAVDRMAAAGVGLAQRTVGGFARARSGRRVLVLLLAVTAAVHAGLVPGHLDENRFLAILFALDAVALGVAALTAFGVPWWRPAVAMLLLSNLVAYVYYVAIGTEHMDAIGLATKLIEVVALALVIHPVAGFVVMGEERSTPLAMTRRIVK